MKYEMKPEFEKRMKNLLQNDEDFQAFNNIVHTSPRNFIRCNTIKISPSELFERLSKKWKVIQPFEKNPEIMVVESDLGPGELGNSIEHILGYYYIQELVSMLPPIALNPHPNEFILDLFAAPGSKTTQIATRMENSGTLIANELKMDRIRILSSNLEKAGVTNVIVTRNDAINLCENFSRNNIKFDKILVDVPCSGEGTLRSSPKTYSMWNINTIKNLPKIQRSLLLLCDCNIKWCSFK